MVSPPVFPSTHIKRNNLFGKTKLIHFVGIGGIGMSGIAHIVSSLGYKISGSDLRPSANTQKLSKQGASIFIGKHRKENLSKDIDVLVTSSAISPANPEVLEAMQRNIPIIRRAEMLAEIMRIKTGIAIAGTHGKTTTTSLTTSIFEAAELSPTSIIGGNFFAIDSNAKLGESDYLICEADESDGSFLDLSPVYSVVTNIDWDHMDFYNSKEELLLHFVSFINKTPFYGKSILCFDDENVLRISKELKKPFVSYAVDDRDNGTGNGNGKKWQSTQPRNITYLAKNIEYKRNETRFVVCQNASPTHVASQKIELEVTLAMAGRHNVLNAMAAIAVAFEIGIPKECIQKGLANFSGVERRLTTIGKWNGFLVIDDYGHHPSEITATLSAVRKHYSSITVVFQPHRYTRTLQHYKDFAKALMIADKVYLAPIYPAGEKPIENVSAKMIATAITHKLNASPAASSAQAVSKVVCLSDKEKVETALQKAAETGELQIRKDSKENDSILITMGAGDISKVGKILVESRVAKK